MKNWIQIVILLAVLSIAGSVGYYYLYFLPQQALEAQQEVTRVQQEVAAKSAQDIEAIRKQIAPTEAELRVIQQQNEAQQRINDAAREKALIACKVTEAAYNKCMDGLQARVDAYYKEKCGDDYSCRMKLSQMGEVSSQFDCGIMPLCF